MIRRIGTVWLSCGIHGSQGKKPVCQIHIDIDQVVEARFCKDLVINPRHGVERFRGIQSACPAVLFFG